MFKLSLLTVLGLLLFSCNESISIDHSDLKQVFSDLTSADSIKGKYYLIDSIQSFDTKSIMQSDTTYLIAYCGEIKNGVWTDSLFDNAKIISSDSLDFMATSNSLEMTPAHYSFSLPYFSKDKKSFIIYYNHYCGNLCAEYSLRLYKKINGKWTFIKAYFSMVS
jgi:hypothetical protein